jgi:hypothetical protein
MNHMTEPHPSPAAFRTARDLLLRHRPGDVNDELVAFLQREQRP